VLTHCCVLSETSSKLLREHTVEIKSPNVSQNNFSDWGSEPILFADDTNVIIYNRNFEDFSSVLNLVSSHIIKCFTAKRLVLNIDKTNIMQFETYALCIGYKENYTKETINTKLIGLQIAFKSIRQKLHVAGVVCDLAKASDCMNHYIVLPK
jgi:hypothetical protein